MPKKLKVNIVAHQNFFNPLYVSIFPGWTHLKSLSALRATCSKVREILGLHQSKKWPWLSGIFQCIKPNREAKEEL